MQLPLLLLLLLLLLPARQAAVLPLAKDNGDLNVLPLRPNGTLNLSSVSEHSDSNLQNYLLLRSVLQALRLAPAESQTKLNIKIYGDGVEQKFPPMLENILQRIQTYFSIYRYTDTSRPIRKEEPAPLTESGILEASTPIVIEPNDIIVITNDDKYITVGED